MSNQDTNKATISDAQERPLVTFALFAYNQEHYIREAVKGALAQTYSPLEIVISDDCSTDRTFEIMQELTTDYRGPHKIVLNRNASNLGLTPHVFHVAHMASGKLLIAAAGDDVSFPNRTRAIVDNWLQTHCSAFTTDEEHYDESGTYMGYFQRYMMANCTTEDFTSVNKSLGCTWGIERNLLLKYASPPSGMINEDVLLGLIAMLHNGVSYIPTATVKRTTGVGISSNGRFQSKTERKIVSLTRRAELLKAMIEVLRIHDKGSAALILEEDLKVIQSLLIYGKTGKAFVKSIVYIGTSGQTKHIMDLIRIVIFKLMHF